MGRARGEKAGPAVPEQHAGHRASAGQRCSEGAAPAQSPAEGGLVLGMWGQALWDQEGAPSGALPLRAAAAGVPRAALGLGASLEDGQSPS